VRPGHILPHLSLLNAAGPYGYGKARISAQVRSGYASPTQCCKFACVDIGLIAALVPETFLCLLHADVGRVALRVLLAQDTTELLLLVGTLSCRLPWAAQAQSLALSLLPHRLAVQPW
jgi:hypothetical protein